MQQRTFQEIRNIYRNICYIKIPGPEWQYRGLFAIFCLLRFLNNAQYSLTFDKQKTRKNKNEDFSVCHFKFWRSDFAVIHRDDRVTSLLYSKIIITHIITIFLISWQALSKNVIPFPIPSWRWPQLVLLLGPKIAIHWGVGWGPWCPSPLCITLIATSVWMFLPIMS